MKLVFVWFVDQVMVLQVLAAMAVWLMCGGDFGGDD